MVNIIENYFAIPAEEVSTPGLSRNPSSTTEKTREIAMGLPGTNKQFAAFNIPWKSAVVKAFKQAGEEVSVVVFDQTEDLDQTKSLFSLEGPGIGLDETEMFKGKSITLETHELTLSEQTNEISLQHAIAELDKCMEEEIAEFREMIKDPVWQKKYE